MADLLSADAIRLDASASSAEDAIRATGGLLVDVGAVGATYVDAMLSREQSVSTYMGEGFAIPHGTVESKDTVKRDALSFLRFPDGVDWNGNDVRVAIGIAAVGDNHVGILSRLATILVDPDQAKQLREASDVASVLALLQPPEGEDS
ncbi:PTS sugar transporter subunit IIA [Aeromicrobium chenweiae]|uniref:Mannitol-specific phosphotransferase enzyme IIA component n=1 Tax=Aeromicrobium chenweiae TaxID=2079793 RepID=A0A2S0WK42_9ACTN|nr:PTS sugar transporter subunit IIA [Aeromicrobium chenweiae]AWB91706.1 PTS sugar transporter subunit IIA [Aeromicrobium chenweiae]TGN32547.1 PTS sugar transporter subunit IIA [Aeromicrobium chenweiae]